MKYALIGVGRISVNHIAAAKENAGDLEFCAVCDLVEENMEQRLQQAGYDQPVARYTDYKKMIAEIQPDFVAIATESGTHAEIGCYCLSHGCHVMIEKPMAMSIEEADLLLATAKKQGKILAACHQNRFNTSVQQLQKALAAGSFGRISHMAAHVRWNRNEDYYTQAPWRGRWASDGGCLMNQCIHNADLLCWLLGDIDEVFAYTDNVQHDYIEGEDVGLALIRAKNGQHAIFEGTVNVYPKNLEETLYVFGEQGTVKLAGKAVNEIAEWNIAGTSSEEAEKIKKEGSEEPVNVYGFGHKRIYADMVDAIRTGRAPLVDGEAGKKALELILAIYKSKKTGLPVKLPLTNFASAEMAGTFGSKGAKS